MLQLVQIFSVCMTIGLLMLNPLLLFSHDDDLDHGAIAMHTTSRTKQVQSVQLHNSSTLQRARSTVDPVGVVPDYSSKIAGVNSKDLVLQLATKDSHWHYVDFFSMKQL